MRNGVTSKSVFGDSDFFVFVDHASNEVPSHLNDLGLSADVLQTHIAWDIGAHALAQEIGQRLKATVLSCGFSRLVIDSNRDPRVADSIPEVSDEVRVPGNQGLDDQMRNTRVRDYFDPYHQQLDECVAMIAGRDRPFVVSVHSFTKRMSGAEQDRPWDVGLLWRDDANSAQVLMHWMRDHSDWVVGDNQPYDARLYNYSVDRHIGPRGLRHLTFEVRQDHLAEPADIEAAGELLSRAILHVAGE